MSSLIKDFILKYLHSGVSEDDSAYDIRQIHLINAFHFIGFLFLFPLGINALYHTLDALSFALLSVAIFLIVNYYYLKISKNKVFASYIMATLFFVLFVYLVYTGGFDNTGPLWIYALPIISMFLLGFRVGLASMALFLMVLILILFVIDIPLYTYDFKVRIILSLLVVTFLASVYEYLQERTFSKLHTLSKELEKVSYRDHLTQVYNRHGIHKKLQNICTRYQTENQNFSVMICDIDYFKKINDNYGHIAGDEVLKKVASEIKTIIRKDDLLGRWGGEEFLVVLPNATLDDAYKIGEKIRKSIAHTSFKYDEHTIAMTVSIGVAEKDNTRPVSDIIRQADTHLYSAKKQGRNTVYPKTNSTL